MDNFFSVLTIICVLVFAAFACVVFFGAPFLPTLKPQTKAALDLLDLKTGQTLVELGSGDGRILRAAAERGIHAIGYELNPLLVIWSRLYNWRQRQLIVVHWGNYWRAKLPPTDGIYVFLLDRYMEKLDKKIVLETIGPTKLVSFAFAVPGKKPLKKNGGLLLYSYDTPRNP